MHRGGPGGRVVASKSHSNHETFSFEELWNRQLDLQVRAFFPADAEFLKSLSFFRRARHVLEIGSGNGAFLLQLSKAFPEKTFRGIDSSAMLTKHARHRLQFQQNVSVDVKDLYALGPADGEYDAILVRLVVQHLPDLVRFLEVAQSLLAPGGHLILVEAEDSELRLEPECPQRAVILKAARKHQPVGGPAAALRNLRRLARPRGFALTKDYVVKRTITGSGKATVRQMWENLASLAQAAWNVEPRMAELRRQLDRWEETPGSKAHFGYRYTIFQKNGSRLLGWLRFLPRFKR